MWRDSLCISDEDLPAAVPSFAKLVMSVLRRLTSTAWAKVRQTDPRPVRCDQAKARTKRRHISVALGVSGAIHLAHAAFADLGGDDVVPEACADATRH